MALISLEKTPLVGNFRGGGRRPGGICAGGSNVLHSGAFGEPGTRLGTLFDAWLFTQTPRSNGSERVAVV